MASQSSQFQKETRSNLRNTGASIKNLEVQMSQIAQQLAGSQASDALQVLQLQIQESIIM
jgi:hypothetical protein